MITLSHRASYDFVDAARGGTYTMRKIAGDAVVPFASFPIPPRE